MREFDKQRLLPLFLLCCVLCRSFSKRRSQRDKKAAGEAMSVVLQTLLSHGQGLWVGPDCDGT